MAAVEAPFGPTKPSPVPVEEKAAEETKGEDRGRYGPSVHALFAALNQTSRAHQKALAPEDVASSPFDRNPLFLSSDMDITGDVENPIEVFYPALNRTLQEEFAFFRNCHFGNLDRRNRDLEKIMGGVKFVVAWAPVPFDTATLVDAMFAAFQAGARMLEERKSTNLPLTKFFMSPEQIQNSLLDLLAMDIAYAYSCILENVKNYKAPSGFLRKKKVDEDKEPLHNVLSFAHAVGVQICLMCLEKNLSPDPANVETFLTELNKVESGGGMGGISRILSGDGGDLVAFMGGNPIVTPDGHIWIPRKQKRAGRSREGGRLLQVPSSQVPKLLQYTDMSNHDDFSNEAFRESIIRLYRTQYRFVTLHDVSKYLEAVSGVAGPDRQSFSEWLVATMPRMYSLPLTPVCREAIMKDKMPVSFEKGRFTGVDFSNITFKDVKVDDLRDSRVRHCKFESVSFERGNLARADLTSSKFVGCKLSHAILIGATYDLAEFKSCLLDNLDLGGGIQFLLQAAKLDIPSREKASARGGSDNQESLRALDAIAEAERELEAKATSLQRDVATIRRQQDISDRERDRQMKAIEDSRRALDEELAEMRRMKKSFTSAQEVTDFLNKGMRDFLASAEWSANNFRVDSLQICKEDFLDLDKFKKPVFDSVDTSGDDGPSGDPGRDGRGAVGEGDHGHNGENGKNGSSGAPAEEQSWYLVTLPGAPDVCILCDRDNDTHLGGASRALRLTHDSYFHLKARGGRGGDGGRGGSGGRGGQGSSGFDAKKGRPGTNGAPGGDGGDGGKGGNGGNGGNGAKISVLLNEHETDLAALFDGEHWPQISGGRRGLGARGGSGGVGGLGGPGGRGLHWDEIYQDQKSDGTWVTKRRSQFTPGGAPGPPGEDGRRGKDGASGQDGNPGIVEFAVRGSGVNRIGRKYSDIWHLRGRKIKPIVAANNTGIIEPGMEFEVRGLEVMNDTDVRGMPSPHPAACEFRILFGIESTRTFTFDDFNVLELEEEVAPRGTVAISGRMPVQVANQQDALRSSVVLLIRERIRLKSTVSRFHKKLYGFHELPSYLSDFDIRYPVELSHIWAKQAITSESGTPIMIRVRNISLVDIGRDCSKHPRQLRVRFHVEDPDGLAFDPSALQVVHEDVAYNLGEPLSVEFPLLKNLSEYLINAKLRFAPGQEDKVPLYEQIPLTAELWLGKYENPKELEGLVQYEVTHVQHAENFHPVPDSDLLLVCNGGTPKELVEAWREIASTVTPGIQVWNVSVKGSLVFNEEMLEYLTGKVLAILDNPYKHDRTNTTTFTSHSLEIFDLFDAARRHNVACCIVGSPENTSFEELIMPSRPQSTKIGESPSGKAFRKQLSGALDVHQDEGYHEIVVKKKWRSITDGYFRNKEAKLVRKLSANVPLCTYVPVSRQEGQKEGAIEVRQGLDRHRALLVQIPAAKASRKVDIFVFLKLLSFDKVLRIFAESTDPELLELAGHAIVSDVVDEIVVLRSARKTVSLGVFEQGGLTRNKLITENMPHVLALEAFDVRSACSRRESGSQREQFEKALGNVLVRIRNVAKETGSWMSVFWGRTAGILKKKVLDVTSSLLDQMPMPHSTNNRDAEKDELRAKWRDLGLTTAEAKAGFERDPLSIEEKAGVKVSSWLLQRDSFLTNLAKHTKAAEERIGEPMRMNKDSHGGGDFNAEIFAIFGNSPPVKYNVSEGIQVSESDICEKDDNTLEVLGTIDERAEEAKETLQNE